MDINLFDSADLKENLKPFTYTRPIADIRIGILKISEKWEAYGFNISFSTDIYLQAKFGQSNNGLAVNGALCPDADLVAAIRNLKAGESLVDGEVLLAGDNSGITIDYHRPYRLISHTWDIFSFNREQLEADFKKLTEGRKSAEITDPHTIIYGKENLFVEEGVSIKAAVINAEDGPVYLGKNTTIHPGSLINGAFAICENSTINMGAKLKGDTTVGPHCKIGGEISNSVIFGYSNKGHEGFLGNSVIGEWCNIGADSNTSNLKNNYAEVKLWEYSSGRFAKTGLQFCGLMMGDHAKCGINTMFNTGTVVGVGANIFGSGFPRNFVPSFSWGGASGLTTFQLRKFSEVATAVMHRRKITYDQIEVDIIEQVFEQTAQYRIWENKK